MVFDHLRFVSFVNVFEFSDSLYYIGRLAFPMFCFALAVNFQRIFNEGKLFKIKGYIKNLFLFSIISEVPHRLLNLTNETVNVLPTLLMGLLLMALVKSELKFKWPAIIIFLIGIVWLSPWLMYGFFGVLLPLACFIALQCKNRYWLLVPFLFAAFCNMEPFIRSTNSFKILSYVEAYQLCFMASLGIVFSFIIIMQKTPFKVWVLDRFGYWFYPVHMLFFAALSF